MNTKEMSREEKWKFLDEIFQNDPQVIRDWLEGLVTHRSNVSRHDKIRKMITQDFEEYAKVFKDLA